MNISEELKKKIVVYTVIMGDYDYLKDPEYVMENCDYICFTNNPKLKSDRWKIVLDDSDTLDNTKWQRRHKVMTHEYLPEYEWSVYVDGNVRIVGDFRKYIEEASKGAPILCLKHPNRENVYDEAEECIKLGKDSEEVIRAQMEGYKEEGYLGENGLAVTNILVRKHMDPSVIQLMQLWWAEIEKKSRRDQLSFNYACWKLGMSYDESELKCWKSPYWVNPGIHTADITKVEDELVDHLQLEAYLEYLIREKDAYIAIKEQELKDANTQLEWKEQAIKDAETRFSWKEQELKDAKTQLGWKEQELKDAKTQLGWKEQAIKDAETRFSWKEQELKDAKTQLGWKEQELKDANTQLEWKEQAIKDAETRFSWKEQELKDSETRYSWKVEELQAAEKRCKEKEEELQLIYNSKRWKLVNMFRGDKNE